MKIETLAIFLVTATTMLPFATANAQQEGALAIDESS